MKEENTVTLPPAPNWYLSGICDCCYDGTVAWGSKNHIVIGKPGKLRASGPLSYTIIKKASTEKVTSVRFTPHRNFDSTERSLLASTGDNTVKVWSLSTLSDLYGYSFTDASREKQAVAAEWSPDQPFRLFCLSSYGTLVSWELRSNAVSSISLEKPTSCLSVCPHRSELIVIGSKTGLIHIVQFRRSKLTVLYKLRGHDTEIVSLSWCPSPIHVLATETNPENGFLLASGAKDSTVFVWRIGQQGRCAIEIRVPASPLDSRQHRSKLSTSVGNRITVNWARPNLLLASSLWGELIAWDIFSRSSSEKPICKLIHGSHVRGLFCIAVRPSNRLKSLPTPKNASRDDSQGKTRNSNWRDNGGAEQGGEDAHGETVEEQAKAKTKAEVVEGEGEGKGEMKEEREKAEEKGAVEEEDEEENRIQVWTLAQDRRVVCCTIFQNDQVTIDYNVAGQSGAVYCVAACPLETTRLAYGAGDAMLRLCTLSDENSTSFDVLALWQKIKGKIRALAWHPEKENFLAYATDEGRVGIFDVANVNKPPILCKHYHRSIVYSLGWGPKLTRNSEAVPQLSSEHFFLYSCADGELVCYDPKNPDKDPFVVLKKDCTEFSWKPNFSCLAVGFQNGSISLLHRNLTLLGRANDFACKRRMVYCLVWHPESTAADLTVSPFRNYLAASFASTEIHIYDLSDCIKGNQASGIEEQQGHGPTREDAQPYCYRVDQPVVTLSANACDVVCLAWSPYISGRLVAGSNDHTAQVWNVETKELLARYTGHCGSVLCCMWSPLHPDFLITGSADFTLRIWNLSDFEPTTRSTMPLDRRGSPEHQNKDRKKKSKQPRQLSMTTGHPVRADNSSREEQQEGNGDENSAAPENDERRKGEEKPGEKIIKGQAKSSKSEKNRKARSFTYFTDADQMMNDEKTLLDAIGNLVTSVRVNRGGSSEDNTDPRNTIDQGQQSCPLINAFPLLSDQDQEYIRRFVSEQRPTHSAAGRFDAAAGLSIWSDDLKEELEEAVQQKRLNDYLVSLAPSLSAKVWKETCEAYASQLIGEGNWLKAASYLLGIHKTYEAIETLEDARLYKEAYAVARCKLCPDDPRLKVILENWASHSFKSGQFLKAAYVCTGLGDFAKAAECLARRGENAKSLEIRAELALLSGEENLAATLAGRAIELLAFSESGRESAAWDLTGKFPRLKFREVQLHVLEEMRNRVIAPPRKTESAREIRDWLDGHSSYELVDSLRSRYGSVGEQKGYYADLHVPISSSDESFRNEKTLWARVTHEIAMAVIADRKEEEWKHLLNALDSIYRFEVLYQRSAFEDGQVQPGFLIRTIRMLDAAAAAGPSGSGSMFEKSESGKSTSLRAYLCLGLLTWLLEEEARCTSSEQEKRENVEEEEEAEGINDPTTHLNILPFVQELLVDALNRTVLRYYTAETEIASLNARLNSILSAKPVVGEYDRRKESGEADSGEDVTSLAERLERLRSEKERFRKEYVAAPNPMIVYGKANQLLDKLNRSKEKEHVRDKFAEAVRKAWTDATMSGDVEEEGNNESIRSDPIRSDPIQSDLI